MTPGKSGRCADRITGVTATHQFWRATSLGRIDGTTSRRVRWTCWTLRHQGTGRRESTGARSQLQRLRRICCATCRYGHYRPGTSQRKFFSSSVLPVPE